MSASESELTARSRYRWPIRAPLSIDSSTALVVGKWVVFVKIPLLHLSSLSIVQYNGLVLTTNGRLDGRGNNLLETMKKNS